MFDNTAGTPLHGNSDPMLTACPQAVSGQGLRGCRAPTGR